MKCAHCNIEIHSNAKSYYIGRTKYTYHLGIRYEICPSCDKYIIFFEEGEGYNQISGYMSDVKRSYLVFPKKGIKSSAPVEVPQHIADDYNEAGLIIIDSPKASAALSRRCLQNVIHEYFKIKKKNLSEEIDEVMKQVPPYVSIQLDAIRQIGNFSAHPIKSQNTGEIVNVEIGEAEWCLDILESLFDFCYVQPKLANDRMEEFNKKLEECGKPLLKIFS